jgi:two-component sensor histidine kinase
MRGKKAVRGRVHESVESFIFPFDSLGSKIHALVFIRRRWASLAFAAAAYAAIILLLGDRLAVSSNYFILVPVIVAGLGFGAPGGLVAGSLGLPANLLLFLALGHPEYSPASKIIAEIAGIAVGLTVGFLADYFRRLELEIKKRMSTEEELRKALSEKGLLLRELNHRVKNNLNVIKSLVQLQRNRTKNPEYLEAADELIGRIFAISLVHDQLAMDQSFSMVDPAEYIEALVGNIESGLGLDTASVGLDLDASGRAIQMEAAISLGLIVNEVLTNAIKHALPRGEGKRGVVGERANKGRPAIRLSFRVEGEDYRLVISDDGPGPAPEASGDGLGLKLVRALASNLGGTAFLEPIRGEAGPVGARFVLTFPAALMEYVQASPM